MPSTNKLYSRKSRKTSRKTSGYIAKFLYTFCGIFASFGVVTKALVAGIVFLATFAIPVSMAVLGSNNASAVGNSNTSNSSSNTVSATLPGSVAIRLLDSTATTEISSLDFNLTPTASGTSSTQSMVVDVATSNPTGYKLYMQSNYQDSSSNYTTNLVHTTNGTPDADISDVIPTSTSSSTLYWNYINPLTNAGIEDPSSKVPSTIPAHGSPDKLDQYFSTTNSRQTEVSFNVSVDTTIVSGTYENQLLFSAVGNPTTLNYTVSFDTDGGTMSGEDITESAAAGTHSITIPNNSDYTPTKQGYNFTHWQIVIPTGSTATASCNNSNICNPGDNIVIHSGIDSGGDFESTVGLKAIYEATYIYTVSYDCDGGSGCPENTTYGPTTDTSYDYTIPSATITKEGYNFTGFLGSDNQTYNIGDVVTIGSSDPDFTLAAQYEATDIRSISTMQEMTSDLCSNTAIGISTTLEDTRDGNTYSVKKLADNNCWMTQNLKLVGSKTLTPSDSDVTSNFALAASTTVSDIWCNTADSACVDQSVVLIDSTTIPYDSSYGAYYNWYAATAGTGTFSVTSGNASSSICPKGWKLPTGGPTGEFQTLYGFYPTNSSIQMITSDPVFVLSGYRSADVSTGRNNEAYYWSNTTYADSASYSLYLYELGINSARGLGKYNGSAIRCIAKNTSSSTLTVNPNGGTWNGSTSPQSFTQQNNTTKTIPNPTTTQTYTISYNGNGQGASYTSSPTTAERKFTSWSLSGYGSYAGGTYQYGTGDASLTAQYSSSSSFNLPTITKSGYSCDWAEGSVSGHQYAGGTTRTISGNTTYYAVCTKNNLNSISKMQEMTPNICANTTAGVSKTLTDNRDNKTYTVKKLNDGKCWMTQNLSYTPTGGTELTSEKTDIRDPVYISEYDITDNCAGYNRDKFCIYYSGNSENGSYYSWYAATASTGGQDGGDMSQNETAPYSICPKGFHLPTGSDYQSLYSSYHSYTLMTDTSGPNFVMSGYRNRTTMSGSSNGYYRSSSATGSGNTYGLLLYHGTYVYPTRSDMTDFFGFSVRCVAY